MLEDMSGLATNGAPLYGAPVESRSVRTLFGARNRWQTLITAFCLLFGLALIAETQGAGDGTWFWYATLLRQGHRLYSEMHLALQPLFVLETEFFQALLGNGWIAGKIPAALHLIAYCAGLWLLAARSGLRDVEKAVLIGCGFFFPLAFEAYRFDDYHVLADCFQLYALLALLAVQKVQRSRNALLLACLLGVLCGLSLTTRLNDGAALVVGVVLGIAVLAPAWRVASLLLFVISTALTLALVVHLTGDSLHDYASYSIFHAAGSKGGAGSVLKYPLLLPLHTIGFLLRNRGIDLLTGYVMLWGVVWAFLVRPLLYRRACARRPRPAWL